MSKVRGYIFSRPFMEERVPQHVQNLVIRNYCERNNLQFLLSATEYAMEDCHLIFEQALLELPKISGLILYSLFQLPKDADRRKAIYEKILHQNKALHFAVEGLHASNQKEFEKIEIIWKVHNVLKLCIKTLDSNKC